MPELDLPNEAVKALLADPATIVFKILPEEKTISLLREQLEEEDPLVIETTCVITMESLNEFLDKKKDYIGLIIINDEFSNLVTPPEEKSE